MTGLGAGLAYLGFECSQTEGLEHVLPAAQPGVLGLDSGQDGLALGLGQPLPSGTKLGLADLVALGLNLVAGLPLFKDRSLRIRLPLLGLFGC